MSAESGNHGSQTASVTPDEVAERIRALTGDRSTPDERERRMRRFYAIKGCTHCVVCWSPFLAMQPVYRETRHGRNLAQVCEGCRSQYQRHDVETLLADPEWSEWPQTKIAAACGVSQAFVSKLAASTPNAASYNSDKTDTVERDAKFCSAACKQRHHRKRVTDAVCGPRETNAIRNGGGVQ